MLNTDVPVEEQFLTFSADQLMLLHETLKAMFGDHFNFEGIHIELRVYSHYDAGHINNVLFEYASNKMGWDVLSAIDNTGLRWVAREYNHEVAITIFER